MDHSMLSPDGYSNMTDHDKFKNISNRMDRIYAYETRRRWRKYYATEHQFAEEYSKENDMFVIAAFQLVKEDYLKIRDFVLKDSMHKFNANTTVLEQIIEGEIEGILLGSEHE